MKGWPRPRIQLSSLANPGQLVVLPELSRVPRVSKRLTAIVLSTLKDDIGFLDPHAASHGPLRAGPSSLIRVAARAEVAAMTPEIGGSEPRALTSRLVAPRWDGDEQRSGAAT